MNLGQSVLFYKVSRNPGGGGDFTVAFVETLVWILTLRDNDTTRAW